MGRARGVGKRGEGQQISLFPFFPASSPSYPSLFLGISTDRHPSFTLDSPPSLPSSLLPSLPSPQALLPPAGILSRWWAMPLFNFPGTLCVDTFLFISAFLATFLLLKKLEKGKNWVPFFSSPLNMA